MAAKHSAAGAPGDLRDREFVEAVLSLNRTAVRGGICRRRWATGMRFPRWEERGVWQRLWKNLQARTFCPGTGTLFMDSTTARAHPMPPARPKKKNGPEAALGRSRGGWTTKIHARDH